MKAIYINLDPYLAAFAAWLKANPADPDTGERATPPPTFDPLPLAVTIPLGESAAVYLPGVGSAEEEPNANSATVDGQTVLFLAVADAIPADALAVDVAPGLSTLAPSAKCWIESVSGDVSVSIKIQDEYANATTIPFTVLVRREQAQGPVDLVDFTPPAAAPSAADIKSALVAEGDGALAGVSLGGAKLCAYGESDNATQVASAPDSSEYALFYGAQTPIGTNSES